jgi:hypothetical protein
MMVPSPAINTTQALHPVDFRSALAMLVMSAYWQATRSVSIETATLPVASIVILVRK